MAQRPRPLRRSRPARRVEFTWKLRVSGDGPRSVAVRASDVACGETIAARASASVVVDSSGPVSAIDVPAAHAGDTAVRWSATDSSGVASYDLEASTDGAAFQPWLTATNVAAATYATAPGHSYAFRVRARDVFGQLGDWATSAVLAVAAPTQPVPPTPAAQQLLSPSLRIASVARSKARTRLTVRGTIASSARSAVHLRVRLRSGRRSRTLAATAVPRAGRWSATLRFPRSLARPRSAEVSARYDADFTLASGTRSAKRPAALNVRRLRRLARHRAKPGAGSERRRAQGRGAPANPRSRRP